MSADPWSRLAAPFPVSALAWHAVAGSGDGARLRLAPHLPEAAVRERLDAVVGPANWGVRLAAWGEGGLIAELTVAGATRAAAIRTPVAGRGSDGTTPPPDAAEAGAAAVSAAAAAFAMLPPVVLLSDGWVDADPETGEALHLPATRAREVPASAAGGTPSVEAAAPDADAGSAPGAKPEAQKVIDRLVERLREEGLGAEAAKLVTSYGGYGSDVERSRELYARLRSLLIERSSET